MTLTTEAPIAYLQRYRVAKLLETSAVRIVVATDAGPVNLNVGGLASKNERLTPEALIGDFIFGGEPRHMVIPWGAVLLSMPLTPPDGGGTAPEALAV